MRLEEGKAEEEEEKTQKGRGWGAGEERGGGGEAKRTRLSCLPSFWQDRNMEALYLSQ